MSTLYSPKNFRRKSILTSSAAARTMMMSMRVATASIRPTSSVSGWVGSACAREDEFIKNRRDFELRKTMIINTKCFIYYHNYILQIKQPSHYRCTYLHYIFALIFEAPSRCKLPNFAGGILPPNKKSRLIGKSHPKKNREKILNTIQNTEISDLFYMFICFITFNIIKEIIFFYQYISSLKGGSGSKF